MKLTVKGIRAMVKQLRSAPKYKFVLRDDIALTIGNAVIIPDVGYMHPQCFRDIMGEEAYQELLKRPRVKCEYD